MPFYLFYDLTVIDLTVINPKKRENSMRQEEMKNTPDRNMFGVLKTQTWARKAFPILVNRAQNGQTITFKRTC